MSDARVRGSDTTAWGAKAGVSSSGVNLSTLIEKIGAAAPKKWARLKNAFGMKTRDTAIEPVQASPEAQKVAAGILGSGLQPATELAQAAQATSRRTAGGIEF